MSRIKDFTIIQVDGWFHVYFYTTLQEDLNGGRYILAKYGKQISKVNISGKMEDGFIAAMEQTGIAVLDNRNYTYWSEDCGFWSIYLRYDEKEVVSCGTIDIPDEVDKVIKLLGIQQYRYGKPLKVPFTNMSGEGRIHTISFLKESDRMFNTERYYGRWFNNHLICRKEPTGKIRFGFRDKKPFE